MDIPAREASVRAAPRLFVVCETQSAWASVIGLRSFETWEAIVRPEDRGSIYQASGIGTLKVTKPG